MPKYAHKTTRRIKTEAEAACQKGLRVNETSPTIPKGRMRNKALSHYSGVPVRYVHPVQSSIFQSDYTTTFVGSRIPLLKFNMIVLKLNLSLSQKLYWLYNNHHTSARSHLFLPYALSNYQCVSYH